MMLLFTLIIRFTVVGLAIVAALVGTLWALVAAACASGDSHLYVIDEDDIYGGLDDLDAVLDDTARMLAEAATEPTR